MICKQKIRSKQNLFNKSSSKRKLREIISRTHLMLTSGKELVSNFHFPMGGESTNST